MKILKYSLLLFLALNLVFCTQPDKDLKTSPKQEKSDQKHKVVVYQVFTRLFGNEKTVNKSWGTIEENGVGKFDDFTDKALKEIKDLGVTHIWYTGILHHAMVTDYTKYGISNDDPDVVKGRAGSPYAVKDYYSVDPDLAVDPSKRMDEFEALISRTHRNGLKILIDIVPNHIARKYEGLNNPEGVVDFGEHDNDQVEYSRNNNFYYVVGQPFKVPVWENGYLPLGGEKNPLIDGKFDENPAKWTGNGSRKAQPGFYDWYETVKVNYGVRPDGSKDFDLLPIDFDTKDYKTHYEFWKGKNVPDSWIKFRDISLFWIDKGVDGFRFDMAEMVPVEFWSYLNSHIKMKNPDAFLLAEVYNPALYRDYLHRGKMDYLYDKVALYDTIKHILQGHGLTDNIPKIQEDLADIEHNMLHFLENHDELRLASPEFAGSAEKGKPAMVVSTCISTSPTMLYFGQEVGEPGKEDAGFGKPSRTSIFDYIGVPHHQRWMNHMKFDGGQLSEKEKELRDFYSRILNFTINSRALTGKYSEIHRYNRKNTKNYNSKLFSFVRWDADEKLVIISNFDPVKSYVIDLKIPEKIITEWNLKNDQLNFKDQLYGKFQTNLKIDNGTGILHLNIKPLESYIFKLEN